MTRSLLPVLTALLTLGFAAPSHADVADGSDGTDDYGDEEEDQGCSHLGRLATPATGLSLFAGGALLLGMRRQD
jgi:hypothetical protein